MPLSEQIQRILLESRQNGSRELSLGLNGIRDEGAKALAAELKQMPNLTSLNLGFNNIGKEGAEALNKALEANRERIKNEVIAFKNELLDKKNESEDVEPIIKKLLNKFGKPASAIHIEKFLKPDEKEQVNAKIVGSKITGIDNIDTNISKFLDIKDCLELNATSQKGAQEPVAGTPPTTSKKSHLDKDMSPDERAKNKTFVEKLKNEATQRDGHSR